MICNYIRYVCACSLLAFATQAMAISNKDLITAALNSEQPVSGIIDGPDADKISRQTKSTSPIRAKASRIQNLSQEGCYRIRFELTQDNVATKSGKLVPFTGGFEFNMCKGGDAPLPL